MRHRRSISHLVINKTQAKLQAHGTNQDKKIRAFLAEQRTTLANQNEKLNEMLAELKDMMMPLISRLGGIEDPTKILSHYMINSYNQTPS